MIDIKDYYDNENGYTSDHHPHIIAKQFTENEVEHNKGFQI